MSATSFRAADLAPRARTLTSLAQGRSRALARLLRDRSRAVGRAVDVGLAAFVVAALVVMASNSDWATIPYHLIFLSTALVYGYRVWPVSVAAIVILGITMVTGGLMLVSYSRGIIDSPELSEIPLMPALLLAMVWHARRRAAANRAVLEMAETQRGMIERERTFFRDTSHAIRTPVTIARGHLELLVETSAERTVHDDVHVALRQLDRMSVLSNRLLALAQLDAGQTPPAQSLDLADFVHEVGDNWSIETRRRWQVECRESAVVSADPVWLALAIDALVENAVHFTEEDGAIQVLGIVRPDTCSIVVVDDGLGIAPEDRDHVFDRFWHRMPPSGPMGSGLGLAMARATARAWGGDVTVDAGDGGGARFEFTLPRNGSPRQSRP
jgi:signal transduction histidine kinase